MSLKSFICDIVYHACQTRAHCPIRISSFKLTLRTACLPRFCFRAGRVRMQKKSKTCRIQPDVSSFKFGERGERVDMS